jgi:hypothetical protein
LGCSWCLAAQASTPTPPPDDGIPLKSISEIASLNATVTIDVNGLVDGRRVKPYIVDGDAFLVAAQNSADPQLRAFGEALWSAEDIHLYVDAAGGYPVALRGSYSGAFEPLKFEGDFDVAIYLSHRRLRKSPHESATSEVS